VENKARILIVDDVPEKLLALQVVLEELDQVVVAANSGADALRCLLADDFAVILLDVNMPDMDGFETAAMIRQRKRSEHTPIIFLTAFPDETHADRGYSLGAVDYILTPVVPEVLRTKVSVFVDLFHMTQQVKRRAEESVALAQEQAARLAAEKANRAKNEFLANVSHELRTPMNAILGMTELALEENLSPVVSDYLKTLQSSANSLLGLLNEILDFSKMEAGKFSLQLAPFRLRAVIEDVRRSHEFNAAEKGLRLSVEMAPDLPDALVGDARRLRQVLDNLLSNAVKFTEHGRVALRIGAGPIGEAAAVLSFSVSDSGVGISKQDQQRIFTPFTQVDATSTRRQGGIGLGLAIAHDLIAAMGGSLAVQSELGCGSEFSFQIPLARDQSALERRRGESASNELPPEPKAADGRPLAKESLRVLLAEDVPANQLLVVRALNKRGHAVHVVQNGREAADSAARESFDVILMDVQMPVLDGFQATAEIRSRNGGGEVPIIALTAHAMPADRQRCLAAGMDGYLAKPLDVRQLVQMVEDYARRQSSSLKGAATQPALPIDSECESASLRD
jgi:signal transduction histidine kinase